MRNDVLQIVFALLVLVLGAGCEDLLPPVLGVGFPILLAGVQVLGARLGRPVAVLFAVAAGSMEDALSGLPPMTSVSFFLLAGVLAWRVEMPCGLIALTYPAYQLWIAVWMGGMNVFTRILLAFPIGLVTALAVTGTLTWAIGKAAVDERG